MWLVFFRERHILTAEMVLWPPSSSKQGSLETPLSPVGTGCPSETCSISICSNQWKGCGQRVGTHEGMHKDPRWPWGGPCRKGACSGHSAAPQCCAGSPRTRPRWQRRWPGTQSCQSDSAQSGCYSYKLGKERGYWEIHWGLGNNRASFHAL